MKQSLVSLVLFALFAVWAATPSTASAEAQSPLPDPVPNLDSLVTLIDGTPLHLTGTLLTREVAEGVFVITEGVYQAMAVVASRGVILVDAPPSLGTPDAPTAAGETLLGAIRNITGKPIRDLVFSHEHIDHIGGAAAIRDAFPRVRIHAHVATIRLIREALRHNPNDPRIRPNRAVFERATIRSGSHVIRLAHFGASHAPGDLFIHLPRQRVLMLVDVVFPGWAPFSRLGLSDHVPGYIAAHERILEFDFDVFVAGHLTRVGDRADIERSRDYIVAVKRAAAEALATFQIGDLSDQENVASDGDAFLFFQNPYALFEELLADVEEACARSVLESGAFDDLAGVDIYTRDNCSAMQNALRIDFQGH